MTTPTLVSDRYRLDRRLGAGGMSTVFLAMDTVLERPVAVKLLAEHLAEDDAFVARFRREALAAAKLQHPNIVQVFDSGADESSQRHFIVMEFVEGPSCADLLREYDRLDIERAVGYVRDACHGLDYAHRAGVVHRDVKPGNLLVSEETDTVKLADFGIAKAAEQTRITQVGSVLGTAAYLSPEQARGEEVGPASDIYSLGVCAYQFLAGRLPHEYSSITELALKQQNERIEPIAELRAEVPVALDRTIRLCLEPDPAARYATALELAEALTAGAKNEYTEATRVLATAATRALPDEESTRALPREERTAATRVATPTRPPRQQEPRRGRRRRRRSPVATIAALLAVLLAGAAVALAVVAAGGKDVERQVNSTVHDQVDYLKNLIRDHEQR
jgi:eukaryotic-like serine/threonine-protein kinase